MVAFIRNVFAPPRDLLLILTAVWVGTALSEKRSKLHGGHTKALNDLIFIGSLAYVLGGRLSFAAEHLSAFIQSPLSLVSLNVSSFDYWGALAAALLAGLAYGQRQQLPLWSTLDALTPLFASLAVGLGFLHLASGTAFGRETNLPWGIDLWGAKRHPTQIYEILASLLTLGLLWFRGADSKPGSNFLAFVALTALSRLVIEAFRGDSTLVFGGLRAEQIEAWVVLLISLVGMEFVKPKEVEQVTVSKPIYSAEKPESGSAARKAESVQKAKRKETKGKTRRSK
jgi:phosphatidylglycerol:prolipoprotein diacylglycerol transferase